MQIHKYINICIYICKYIIFIYYICEYSLIVLDFFPEFLHQVSSLSLAVHKVRVSISLWVLGNIQLCNDCQLKGLIWYLIDISFAFFWLPIILNAFESLMSMLGFFCTLCVSFAHFLWSSFSWLRESPADIV